MKDEKLKERFLQICRSQVFRVDIPDDMSDEEVREFIYEGEMYSDEWYEKFSGEEVGDGYEDDWIELVNGEEVKRIITF